MPLLRGFGLRPIPIISSTISSASTVRPTTSIFQCIRSQPTLSSNHHKSPSSRRSFSSPSFTPSLPSTARYASTDTSPSTSQSSSSSSSSAPSDILTWNDFLRLRRTRRYYNLGGSVVSSAASVTTAASILANEDIAGMGQQMTGLDPFVILAVFTAGFAGFGWLLGPILGTTVFGMVHRRVGGGMRAKERDFFDRIKKYRVDPTSSSMQNPVPDYYGEKITSVAGYRRWLKDQRAFNKKRQSFL